MPVANLTRRPCLLHDQMLRLVGDNRRFERAKDKIAMGAELQVDGHDESEK